MIKDIKFNGYTTAPSDYESPDGALAASIDIIAEDNQLKPLFQPSVKVALPDGCEVMAIHKTNKFTHYIVSDALNYSLYWMDESASSLTRDSTHKIGGYYTVDHIDAVGNTLLVFTSEAINYWLWKEGKYNELGDHLPNVEISFGLKGKARFYSLSDDSKSTFNISFDGISSDALFNTWTEANKTKITSQVMAKVNKFLREQSVNKGRFALPFLVRYALRLFDGSLVCHSAPILMNPSTNAGPVVFWTRATGRNSYTDATCDIMLMSCSLDYKLVADSDYDYYDLQHNWGDIVKSVDVFISAPIYTYDQNGQCSSFADTDNFETKFIGALDMELAGNIMEDRVLCPVILDGTSYTMGIGGVPTFFRNTYTEWSYSQIYSLCKNLDRSYPSTTINLPEYSDDKVRESIRNVSNFYLLTSIPIDELSTSTRKDIKVGDEYLQSLVTREVMTDDYLSHDRLQASFSHGYNARLNLAGVKRNLFRGFYPSSMFAYKNHSSLRWQRSGYTLNIGTGLFDYCNITARVYIKENGETYCVQVNDSMNLSYFISEMSYPTQEDANNNTNGRLQKMSWGCYVFYPNSNAFKLVITDYRGSYAFDLKPHDFLNGAYALIDYELQRQSNISTWPQVTNYQNIVDVPNKIYTSEVNNPFYFPVLGINTVGTGTILGISSATKALSQGQFGQFPLYAFTTEGVWALEVSATGSYSAKQPVTRDVCINPKSITQLDSAVLFATDRGIMLLTGSQADCITDAINAEQPFNVLTLPHMDELHTLIGHDADTCFPTKPFLTFLRNCAMIYDYVHQHIIVYNPAYTYAYVYSMRSKEWGMMHSNIASGVNSYPDALAMTNDNKLVSFNDTDETVAKGLYVTRPIKLETPDVLKTIDVVIQRGMFQRGDVQTVLYGSRDLYNWFIVWSSKDHFLRGFRGTPYKYYRIAGIATLTPDKSVFGASLQYTPKYLNQPR